MLKADGWLIHENNDWGLGGKGKLVLFFKQGTCSKMMQKRGDFGKWKRRILENVFFRAPLPLLYELGKFYEYLA